MIPEESEARPDRSPPDQISDLKYEVILRRALQRRPAPAAADRPPAALGRFRLVRELGQGAFGRVYLAHDPELDREVALKVPHPEGLLTEELRARFLREARILASLDHPNIVPVHDVGQTEDHRCFVVSKLIAGRDLAEQMSQERLSPQAAATLVAAVADALHHAHRRGLVHRDVKPANIFLDATGKPYLGDFGLALGQDFGTGRSFAGTPAYMSPEQARREGHRVDGRSDIFSLGVVFYELLTGRLPFEGTTEETLERIKAAEPRPPRQINPAIPRELERICLKALAKRAVERYATAQDLAEDLRHTLEQMPEPTSAGSAANKAVVPPAPVASTRLRIIPKGLRAFDSHDADFFLDLVPGPRDRDSLPDSIRFWKTRIEECDADRTFTAGLIYGPSGCGKSSLVQAGLLPRLGSGVLTLQVEASAEATEARLRKGLQKLFPDLPVEPGLVESLASLRQGGAGPGRKLLLVLDQFEQWLHARRDPQQTELVSALRHCDGEHVQCLVLVRDDFWMATTRFFAALEIPLLQGHNCAAVDRFGLPHARKVLAAFGQAFAALPEERKQFTPDQEAFLDQAVAGLAEEGQVISVRLALFAEMVKKKLWTARTLRDVGGMAGVGVAFLEETFAAPGALPQHRLHLKGAQAVLKALLPEAGSTIKGKMRSRDELLAASGYLGTTKDFGDLLRILDSDLRLITPADAEGVAEEEIGASPAIRYYQLTHDYLVPALRDWLTRKQRETRRGRAELRLAERASLWNSKPESRHLPAWWEWASIRLLTSWNEWTPSQRQMMRKASRYHLLRGTALAVILAVLTLVGLGIRHKQLEQKHADLAASLVRQLRNADISQVPQTIEEMKEYRAWTDPRLREALADASVNRDARQHLHLSLALLPVDAGQFAYLYQRLLQASPQELRVLRDALKECQPDELAQQLRLELANPQRTPDTRLRAACALAGCDPAEGLPSDSFPEAATVVGQLLAEVQTDPSQYGPLVELLRPLRRALLKPLTNVFRNPQRTVSERNHAANLLAEFLADQPELLVPLLLDASREQFAALFAKLKDQAESGVARLRLELTQKPAANATVDARDEWAKRQANGAVALLRLGQADSVWPLLRHSRDPSVRSYLIHRFRHMGADAHELAQRLEQELNVTIRRALALALGEYSPEVFPPEERARRIAWIDLLYKDDPDPGIHAAAEWMLRQWHQDALVKQRTEEWMNDPDQRKRRHVRIREALVSVTDKTTPQWYVNSQGQTMVVLPRPVEFTMGSPPEEGPRRSNEDLHPKRIGRTFAIAATPVTVEQFEQFLKETPRARRAFAEGAQMVKKFSPQPDCPVVGVSWYLATEYCNWLSAREGLAEIQWCYVRNAKGEYGEGMKLARNYLKRTGYRLPTEAEWEYACRAGATTSRYYGDSVELLERYARYLVNSADQTSPVGRLKPNDFGLFDMHGNVWNWCLDRYDPDARPGTGQPVDDQEDSNDKEQILNKEMRAMRGSAFANLALYLRSAYRTGAEPSDPEDNVGFRAARSFH
jgi:serine/threonine protein kinase/formylglycine-generating enzyme required for sulfatase activity